MTNAQDARKLVQNAMFIAAGVVFVATVAVWIAVEKVDARGIGLLGVAMLFGFCGYGLAIKRGWATHVSLFLTTGIVISGFSLIRTPAFGIIVLMIVTLPFVTFLEIVEIMNWKMSRRRSA
jgi:hypothetical protein